VNGQIELDGEWEVGPAEISFPFDVDNVLEGEYYDTFEELSAGLHDAQVLRIAYVTSPERAPAWFSFDKERNTVKMTVTRSLCLHNPQLCVGAYAGISIRQ